MNAYYSLNPKPIMNILSLFQGPLGLITIIWLALIVLVFAVALMRFITKCNRIIKDCDAIVLPSPDGELGKTPIGKLLLENTRTDFSDFAEGFLNIASVAAPYKLNLRLAHSFPGILTSLGILGTFIGLSFAVLKFDSTSSETIRDSINSLLSGMGTAFFTSVFGMLFSVIFLWLERKKYNALCNSIDALCHSADKAYRISPEQFLDERLQGISEQISSLQISFGDNLDKVFDQKVTPVMSNISKKLENPAQAVVDGLILEFQNMTNNLADLLSEKVEAKMSELMAQIVLATDAMKEIPSIIETAAISLKGIPEEIAGSIDAQKGVTAEFAGQIEHLKSIEELYSAAIKQITTANNDLANAKSSIASLTSKVSDAAQSIESAATGVVKSNEKMLADVSAIYDLNRTVTDQIKTYSEHIKGIEGGLKGIFGEIEKGLTSYANTSSKNMQGLLDVFTSSVTNACQSISNATAPIHEAIDGILKALDKTEKSAQALLERVEHLPQQR